MRNLVLLRGCPGSGKSTFIENNNLKQYTLCPDELRLLYQTPVLCEDGSLKISQNNDKRVWKLLFDLLEKRMERGEFTIVDATHTKTSDFKKYEKLSNFYRYRIYCVDFSNIPIDIVKKRNKNRDEYKFVPENVIDNMYSRFATQSIPKFVTVIKPDDFKKTFEFQCLDFNNWEKIHHIGDIHGCYTVLMEYLKDGLKDDELYIFIGDYIDRGLENAEVIKFLISIVDKPNVILLMGNHEIHLMRWSKDIEAKSRMFENKTKYELENKGINKKEVRKLYCAMRQLAFYKYDNKIILVTHAGISTPYKNFSFIATEQFIKGVGTYSTPIDEHFINNLNPNDESEYYQIHGHRNVQEYPIQVNERCFNLEGKVEFGKYLRIVTLDKNGFNTHEIKNDIYHIEEDRKRNILIKDNNELISLLRKNKYVREIKLGNNISSFNFTKEAFYDKKWDDISIKARGLFINVDTTEIVTRSYNKFFNINERAETKIEVLNNNIEFPVCVYKKENGFLGLVGYDSEQDSLFLSSKSTNKGQYSDWFKNIFYDNINSYDKELNLKNKIKANNISLVFECIDPKNDPHIVEYPEAHIVLLDGVIKEATFNKLPYENVCEYGKEFNFKIKEKEYTFDNWNELYEWHTYVTNNKEIEHEGFVLEGANSFMVKLKLPWYSFWKHMRSVKDSIQKYGHYKYTGSLLTPLANNFYAWLKTLPKEDLQKDIITLRNEYFKQERCLNAN